MSVGLNFSDFFFPLQKVCISCTGEDLTITSLGSQLSAVVDTSAYWCSAAHKVDSKIKTQGPHVPEFWPCHLIYWIAQLSVSGTVVVFSHLISCA